MSRRGQSIRRTWAVVLAGIVITVVSVALVPGPKGVYWARTDLVFLPPRSSDVSPYGPDSYEVVYFAAVVEREFNGGGVRIRGASSDAALFGFGVRSGYAVGMPNSGSQWRPSYFSPKLNVEVVDPDEAVARERMAEVLNRLNTIVRQRQVDANVSPGSMVTTTTIPERPTVTYATGSARRQQVALVLLGLLLTWGAASIVEARDLRRRSGKDKASTGTVDIEPPGPR